MKRMAFLDAIKGMAILLVVAGHIMIRMGISDNENIIWTLINSIHLPLFFLVSGFFCEAKPLQVKGLFAKARALLLPAFIFYIIFTLSRGGNPWSFVKYGFQEYWFTFVLFEIFLIYFICSSILKKYKYIALIVFSLVGIAFLSISSTRGGQIGTVLCLENIAKYLQFFTLGILLKKYEKQVFSLLSRDWVKCLLLSTYIFSLFICYSSNIELNFNVLYKFNHDLLLRYTGVLLVISLFYYKSDWFNRTSLVNKILLFVGKRTLDVYLIHYLLLPSSIPFPEILSGNSMWYIQLIILVLSSLIVVAGSLAVSELIRFSTHLSSLMLGTKNKR